MMINCSTPEVSRAEIYSLSLPGSGSTCLNLIICVFTLAIDQQHLIHFAWWNRRGVDTIPHPRGPTQLPTPPPSPSTGRQVSRARRQGQPPQCIGWSREGGRRRAVSLHIATHCPHPSNNLMPVHNLLSRVSMNSLPYMGHNNASESMHLSGL